MAKLMPSSEGAGEQTEVASAGMRRRCSEASPEMKDNHFPSGDHAPPGRRDVGRPAHSPIDPRSRRGTRQHPEVCTVPDSHADKRLQRFLRPLTRKICEEQLEKLDSTNLPTGSDQGRARLALACADGALTAPRPMYSLC
jgi:hypothetical protein